MKLTLGEKFQIGRQNAERTELEMAKALNLALPTYEKIENDFLYPTENLISKVAKFLGVTYEEFLAIGEE